MTTRGGLAGFPCHAGSRIRPGCRQCALWLGGRVLSPRPGRFPAGGPIGAAFGKRETMALRTGVRDLAGAGCTECPERHDVRVAREVSAITFQRSLSIRYCGRRPFVCGVGRRWSKKSGFLKKRHSLALNQGFDVHHLPFGQAGTIPPGPPGWQHGGQTCASCSHSRTACRSPDISLRPLTTEATISA